MEDYRKIYKEKYNIDFSDKYDVHHLNLNHNDNEIDNLLLLPKELHHSYHELLKTLETEYDENPFSKHLYAQIHSTVFNGNYYNLIMMKQFIDVLLECNKWYDYKLFLEGKIPNIHNIILDK